MYNKTLGGVRDLMKVIPNILSVFRICLVPVFVIVYFIDGHEIKYYAILVYAIAGLSDFLDGYIARKYEAQSKLGKLLDPLGDKLMTFTVLICITITNFSNYIFLGAVILFFIKEILMGIGGLIIHKKAHVELPPANFIGKTSTFVFFIVCAVLMLFRTHLSNLAIALMISVAMCLSLIALFVYLSSYIKIMKSRSKKTNSGEVECSQQSVQDVNETPQ